MAFSAINTAAALLIALLCLFNAREPKSVTGQRWLPEPAQQFRAPVPPSGRNPCTNIPGQGHGRCTLEEELNGDGNNNENIDSSAFMAASVANQTQPEAASAANQTQTEAASVANQTQLEAASEANQTRKNHSLSS